jgi:LPS-assembly lipoprotein
MPMVSVTLEGIADRMSQRRLSAALALLGSLLLAGCGFHLRGSAELAPSISELYIQGGNPYGPLATELRRALRAADVDIRSTPAEATAILTILREDFDRRVLSVGSRGKAREYGLTLAVDFEVRTAQGESLVPRQTVFTTRDYTFDPNRALASSDEEAVFRQDMAMDAVQQILWRLQAP